MILNDKSIIYYCSYEQMIHPYSLVQVRENQGKKVISYGMSSFGYDIRLAASPFYIFTRRGGTTVNPKDFDKDDVVESALQRDEDGLYYVLPGNSYGLGVSYEKFKIPPSIMGLCVGKSTYARCGVIVNVTPAEPGWEGYLTIEVSNSSPADVRIYVNEGIAQMIFFEGSTPAIIYDEKRKYMHQNRVVTFAK